MSCKHESKGTRLLETSAFMYAVAAGTAQNPAAHGNVCVHVECQQCGARRKVLINGHHLEHGPWGEDRMARLAIAERLEAHAAKLARDAVLISTKANVDGQILRVRIGNDGYLHGTGCPHTADHVLQALALAPHVLEAARELRLACMAAQDARANV